MNKMSNHRAISCKSCCSALKFKGVDCRYFFESGGANSNVRGKICIGLTDLPNSGEGVHKFSFIKNHP